MGARIIPLLLLLSCTASERPSPPPAKKVSVPVVKPQLNTEGLVVELKLHGPYVAGQPMEIEMIVRNPTDEPKTFCRYHTPFEGMRNNIFSVSASIADVEYRGKMAKRAPPGPEDYITLAPGAAKSARIDLAKGYDIPPGGYALTYRATDISGLPMSNIASLSVSAP